MLNWWVLFLWRDYPAWSFETFLMVFVWATSLYLMCVFVYPRNRSAREPWAEVFAVNHRWIIGSFVAFALADIVITALRGDLLDPP